MSPAPLVLVTGVTGYVGGRLVPELLAAGYRVRALARHPERLSGHDWRGRRSRSSGATSPTPTSLREALDGRRRRLPPRHPARRGRGHRPRPPGGRPRVRPRRRATRACRTRRRPGPAAPARRPGARGPRRRPAAPRASRPRVLRAGVVIGSGSASFEMLRYLTERLPVMVTPRWLRHRVQPVAVRDVLRYLVGRGDAAARGQPVLRRRRPGRAQLPRHDAALRRGGRAAPARHPPGRACARRGCPRTGSAWSPPCPHRVARPLVAGLVHDAVCSEQDLQRWVPDPPGRPAGLRHRGAASRCSGSARPP